MHIRRGFIPKSESDSDSEAPSSESEEEEEGMTIGQISFFGTHMRSAVKISIHCLQHIEEDGLGAIYPWIEERGYPLQTTKIWETPTFPDIDSFDLLIILGGTMSTEFFFLVYMGITTGSLRKR